MSRCNAIVFDLDGTLINTAPDVRLALNHMLKQYQLPAIKEEDIYELIGLGAISMIERAFAKFGKTLALEDLKLARQCYLAFYAEHPVVDSYIYPDVVRILQELKAAQYKLGICTNKPGVMTRLVLEKCNLKSYFSAIVAGDEISNPKPHGEHIHHVLGHMQCVPDGAIMVGDSDIDQKSAEQAGIDFIGVTYGYHGKAIQTDYLIDHFNELPKAIANIATGKI